MGWKLFWPEQAPDKSHCTFRDKSLRMGQDRWLHPHRIKQTLVRQWVRQWARQWARQ